VRILVTGATGFVGQRLVGALAAAGHTVIALSRTPERALRRVPRLAQAWPWTLDSAVPLEAVEGADAIVHLAGETVQGRWTDAKRQAIRDSRVVGTRRLVDALAAAERPPPALICASAIGFYGERGDDELDEDEAGGDDFLARVCRDWEDEARRAGDLGVRVCCLRIGIVLGADGGALEKMWLPFSFGLGGRLGSGRQWWSWVHIDDLLAIIRRAIEDDTMRGPWNATAPNPVQQRAFARTLASAVGRPLGPPAPAWALQAALGGFAVEILSSKRVLPKRLLEGGFRFAHPTVEAALAAVVRERHQERTP
jgi:uncharacterized protein (TIGR01777 family)